MSLPLNTKEGFVLSRIDGVASVEDISIMVGIQVTDLLPMLDRLADLGAVKLSWRTSAQPRSTSSVKPPPRAAGESASQPPAPPKGADHPAVQRVLMAADVPAYAPEELDEPGELTTVQKERVLNVYYGMAGKTYYELLGLTPSADKKAVRAAYFELSRLFHPDSLFGKDLGSFKAKMEAVFKRLTEAYEVLGRNQRRKEYDEYLAQTAATSAMQHTLDRVDQKVRSLSTSPPEPTRAQPPAPPAVAAPPAQPVTPPRAASQVQVRPPISQEERKAQARERLRRSFSGAPRSIQPVVPPSASAVRVSDRPAVTAAERRDSLLSGLRGGSRPSTGSGAGAVEPVLAHLRRARDAELKGDLLGAAAALQAALALQPNHKDIQAQYERVSKAVTRSLADNYEKQALYEEKQGKWGAAAASWERVAEGRPDDPVAARAVASALLRAAGDITKALRYARRAVDIGPSDAANVVSFARVLLAAGQRDQAKRELEKAVKLDPQNEMIKHLLREAR